MADRGVDVLSWNLTVHGTTATAAYEEWRIAAATPGLMWSQLARQFPDCLIHLSPYACVPRAESVRSASHLIGRQEIQAVASRVQFRDGHLSREMTRLDETRYGAGQFGAILLTPRALQQASVAVSEREWDAFWGLDLLSFLGRAGVLELTGLVTADVPALDAPIRQPGPAIERASFPHPSSRKDPCILIYGNLDATVSLYFDGLPPDLQSCLRFLRPGEAKHEGQWLLEADLVIIVRGFEHAVERGVTQLLKKAGIPYVWFVDDDFIALREEESSFDYYSRRNVEAFLRGAAGTVTTSEALVAMLGEFHHTVILWPCVLDEQLSGGQSMMTSNSLRLGCFGGAFRHDSLVHQVLPAIGVVRGHSGSMLFVTPEVKSNCEMPQIRVVPFVENFARFVVHWHSLGIQAVVHPYGKTRNIGNKSMASVLVSRYIGAVPIVADEPAYARLTDAVGVLKASEEHETWLGCLTRAADPEEAGVLFSRLEVWCKEEFAPAKARQPFEMLRRLAVPSRFRT